MAAVKRELCWSSIVVLNRNGSAGWFAKESIGLCVRSSETNVRSKSNNLPQNDSIFDLKAAMHGKR